MSDKFKYTAGLNNVGSYQVSGKPFVTASTISDGVEQQVEFPQVTNNITVKLDSETYNSLFLSASANSKLFFKTENTISNGGDGDSRSLTMWLSASDAMTNQSGTDREGGIVFGCTSNGFSIREKDAQIEGIIDANGIVRAKMGNQAGWHFLALTIESDASAIAYVNGVTTVARTKSIGVTEASNFGTSLQIGPQNFAEGEIAVRDCIMWDDALSAGEVLALYQASASYGNPAFGVAEKLFWFKPDESVALGSKANGNRLKNHGSLATGDLILEEKGVGEVVEIISDAPFTDSGDLRVHYRSTGSLPNVETNNHYWTLDSQNESITMNVKTKEIYLSSNGGDVDYSLHADLTSIPTSMMYEHTGSGVDE